MEVEARARFMRIAPRKARLVADTVVGMPVKDALTILQFTPRAAAVEVYKVVKSAAANATNNFNQDEDALVVKRIQVNEGPTLKRGRPRARGMYFSIFKRTCHITAVVETVEQQPRPRRRAAAAGTTPAPAKKRATRAAAPKTKAEKPEAKAQKPEAEVVEPEATLEAPETAVEAAPAAEAAEVEAAAEEERAVEAEAEAVPVETPAVEVEPAADTDTTADTDTKES